MKYEFNIEDIKEIKIVTKNDPNNYFIQFIRDGLYFNKTFNSLPYEDPSKSRIYVMCPNCGKTIRYKKKYFYSDNFNFSCGKCNNNPSIYDEDYVKDYVLSLMTEDEYYKYDIYINNIHIV